MRKRLNRLLVFAILLISTVPLYAQRQQQNVAKLKADAQKVVGIIKGDKAKNETFCQMVIVGKAIDEAIQEKDNKKAAEPAQKLSDLEENLGPEYVALVEAFRNIDPNSKEAQEIVSTFAAAACARLISRSATSKARRRLSLVRRDSNSASWS